MAKTIPQNELFGLLGHTTPATKNNVVGTCPFCGKADHFFINTITQKWDCKKCGRDGGIFTLLKHFGKLYLLEGTQVDHQKKLALLREFMEEYNEEEETAVPDRKMPMGYRRLQWEDDSDFTYYLRKRKFTKQDFEIYRPGYTELKQKYEGYVLLPIDRDFSIKGFMGRYIYHDNSDGDPRLYNPLAAEKLRYENSKETPFASLLFGYDQIDYRTKNLILVEGGFDMVGLTTELNLHTEPEFKCCSTFGKKVSKEQIKLIKRTNVKDVFLMYDGRDAINDMKRRAFELEQADLRCHVCYLYPNDPADSTAAELLQSLHNAKRPKEFWMDKINKRKLK